jgi:hypothetical protein
MKNAGFLRRCFLVVVFSFFAVFAQAETSSIPKFSIVPIQRPTGVFPANGVQQLQYLVTNNTVIPRQLTMSPLTGVIQVTGAPGTCSNPFFLEHGQSCLLVFNVVGSNIAGILRSPVVVCKTIAEGDNRPDGFLCSQTGPGAGLDFRFIGPLAPAPITASPNPLTFSTVVGGVVTVTNTSPNASANNIQASAPTMPGFSVSSQCPPFLLPNQSCQVIYNSANAGSAQSTIQGINTNPLTINMTAVKPSISLSSSSLSFIVQNAGTVVVTNTSANGASALNIGVVSLASPFFVVANSCSTANGTGILAPGQACTISFTTNTNANVSGTAIIQGANTDPLSLSLTASPAAIAITAINPTPTTPNTLSITVNQQGQATITNNTANGAAFNVAAKIPLGSPITVSPAICPPIVPGGSCVLTFSSPTATSATNIPIAGSNTNTISNFSVVVILPTISVSPAQLSITNGGTGTVTVTNTSTVVAAGVGAFPPVGSPISVLTNTCAPSLAPNASCTITFQVANQTSSVQQSIPIFGMGTNRVGVNIITSPATLSLNTSTIVSSCVAPCSIGTITVTNTSNFNALGVTAAIPSNPNNYSITANPTGCTSIAANGGTCAIQFQLNSGTLANSAVDVTIQGTNTTAATLYLVPIQISASPSSITIGQSIPGVVTITQDTPNPFIQAFQSVEVTIPPGSPIQVDIPNSTCYSGITFPCVTCTCTVQLTGGPLVETQVITVQGTDASGNLKTNPVTFTANSVGTGAVLLTVSPTSGVIDVEDPGAPLIFTVENSPSSSAAATDITIALPATWTDVGTISSAGCASLAAGSSCTIAVYSLTPHIAATGIKISGTNTTGAPVSIAFEKGGGLVYQISSTETKVVNPTDNNPSSTGLAWGSYVLTGASSKNNGSINQAAILANDPAAAAAQACRDYTGNADTDWYLPAINELSDIYLNLFSKGFGNFATGTPNTVAYWSSTENDIGTAWFQSFVTPTLLDFDFKNLLYRVRCVRKA